METFAIVDQQEQIRGCFLFSFTSSLINRGLIEGVNSSRLSLRKKSFLGQQILSKINRRSTRPRLATVPSNSEVGESSFSARLKPEALIIKTHFLNPFLIHLKPVLFRLVYKNCGILLKRRMRHPVFLHSIEYTQYL